MEEAKKELSESFQSYFESNDLVGDDVDRFSLNLGLGYQYTSRTALVLNYTAGIAPDYVSVDLNLDDDGYYGADSNINMLEFDARYKVYQASPDFFVYLLAGVNASSLEIKIEEVGGIEESDITLDSEKIIKIGAKVGAGIQWDFSDNWGLKLGYNRYSFLSMQNTYMKFEYRF